MVIRDKYGWPVERMKGRPFTNFLRLLIHGNIFQTWQGRPWPKKVVKLHADIINMRDTSCMQGNWNYSPYMMGMANGLILAASIIEGKEPHFKNRPAEWLEEKHVPFFENPATCCGGGGK